MKMAHMPRQKHLATQSKWPWNDSGYKAITSSIADEQNVLVERMRKAEKD
jgi:hypothetical protein